MADSTIKIDVKVDDKGSTEKLALNSKKAAKGLDDTAKSARTADRNLKGASQQSANGTKNFSKMAQGMSGGLVPAYATFAASVFALTALFQGLKDAADFRVIKESQVAFSSATGVGMITLTSAIKSATDGLVGFREASSAAAIGTASGLNTEQITKLAKGAREVSLILGRDVTDSFNRLIRGVTKAEPELLDELGITLRLKDATENYAASINKAASELSLYERSQAVAAEVQTQLDSKYSAVAASVELQSNAIAQLGVEFEKIIHPLQKFASAVAEPTARFLADNIQALTGAFALFAIPIIKAAIPALDGWKEKSIESAAAAKASYAAARAEIDQLAVAQARLRMQGANPAAAAQAALQGQTGLKGGAAKLQAGDFTGLTKRELSGLLAQAEKGRGIIAKLPKDMKVQYLAALREMKNGTATSMASISASIKNMVDRAKLQFSKLGLAWKATMAGMRRLAAMASRFINGLFRLAGIFGIIFLLKDLVVKGAQSMGFLKQAEEATALGRELEQLNTRLEESIKQFEKFAQIQEKYYSKNAVGAINPTLEGLGQVGNFIDTNRGLFEDSLKTVDKYNKAVSDIKAEKQAAQDAAQARIDAVQKEIDYRKENKKKLREFYNLKPKDRLTPFQQTTGNDFGPIAMTAEMSRELKNAREERDAIIEQQSDFEKSFNPGFLERFGKGFVDVAAEATKAEKNIKQLAGEMVAGLRAGRIETQAGGARLLELGTKLAETGNLAAGERAEFEALTEALVGLGAEARLAKQEFAELDRQFSTKITGITTFRTSVSDMIARTQRQIADFDPMGSHTVSVKQADGTVKQEKREGGRLAKTADAPQLLKLSEDRLEILEKIREQEVGIALRKLGGQKAVNALMVGATKLEAEQIRQAQQLAEIDSQKIAILNNINLLKDSDAAADQAKVQQLLYQLDILGQQEGAIRRNQNLALDTIDKMEDAFENKFSSGLADILKGKESSFSDMIGNAAIAGLEAAADNIAKNITQSLFGIDKEKSPEEKIKEGMKEAANYHALKIQEALEGRAVTGTGPEGTLTMDDVGKDITKPATQFKPDSYLGKMEGIAASKDPLPKKIGDAVSTSFKSLKDTVGPIFSDLKTSLGSTFSSLTSSFGSIFSSFIGSIGPLFSGLLSGLGGVLGSIGSGIMSIFGFADGGIASPGKKMAYSTGGIAKGSSRGYPAVLHGTEAVVPLPNGRSIPVDMKSSGNQQNNVTVNISTDGTTSTQSDGGMDQERLGKAVAAAVQKELQHQKRSGGILSPYGAA